MPLYIYASITGLLSYSLFDYYAIAALWKQFIVLRVLCSVNGLVLLTFLKRNKISPQQLIIIFHMGVFLFFAYGSSLMVRADQLLAWNLSIVVAGCFWPFLFLVIPDKITLLLSSFFLAAFFLFYYLFSIFDIKTMLVNGGIFFLFGTFASYFLSFPKYRMHFTTFQLHQELSESKNRLEIANSELKEANNVKDKLFSIIAHDLKNPFHNIIGLSSSLGEDITQGSQAEISNALSLITVSATRAYKLLENLLVWANASRGQLAFNPQYLHTGELMRSNVALLENLAAAKHISIHDNSAAGFEVFADRTMLDCVIQNLITNAIKFTPENGRIDLYVEDEEQCTRIRIKDSGVGIPEALLQTIFKLDTKSSSKGTAGEQGTGLGLPLCKELIQKHGGRIWVESEVGKGTEFSFTIPKRHIG